MGIDDILRKLSEGRQRECVQLRYGEDLTEAQIASRLEISERRVRYVFAAARKRLRLHGLSLPRPRFGRHHVASASQYGTGGLNLDAI